MAAQPRFKQLTPALDEAPANARYKLPCITAKAGLMLAEALVNGVTGVPKLMPLPDVARWIGPLAAV